MKITRHSGSKAGVEGDVLYEPDCELVVVEKIGKKTDKIQLEVGTRLFFVDVIDDPNDLSKSLVIANYYENGEQKTIMTKEVNVKPVEEKRVENTFNEFNKLMMQNNPELRIYHPNFFVRTYYKVYYFFKKRFGNE